MRVLTFSLSLITTLASAQVFTHTAMTISTENNSNTFPLFHSATRPRTAAIINKVLQMNCLLHTNVEKQPTAYEDSLQYSSWSFGVDYSNDRMVQVHINHFFPKQSMNSSDYTEVSHYWFDTVTGDPFSSSDFISVQGADQLRALVKSKLDPMIRQQHAVLIKKYPSKNFPEVIPDLDQSLQKLKDNADRNFAYCLDHLFEFGKRSFSFTAYWDGVDNDTAPEFNNPFTVTLNSDDVQPFTSDFWSYYITRTSNTIPQRDAISHVWSGFVGEKIPVTMVIKSNGDKLTGTEVYDKYGGAIPLSGTLKGNSFQFSELDENEKAIAVFQGTVDNGKLSGVWKKVDGSKTMNFRAATGELSIH